MTTTLIRGGVRCILALSCSALMLGVVRAQDSSLGVPVYLTASSAGGSGTLRCSVSGLVPGVTTSGMGWAASTNADATGYYNWSATGSGSLSLPTAVLALQPNHVYWANFVTAFSNAQLSIVAPQGYTVIINNMAQEGYSFQPPANTSYGIPFALIPDNDFAGNAGECTELSTGQVHWEVALGWQMNGDSAGTLALSDLGTESVWNASNVQSLYLSQVNNETSSTFGTIFNTLTTINPGYIVTNQALVKITYTSTSGAFTITFYPWSSVATKSAIPKPPPTPPPAYSPSITGPAYLTYVITTSTGVQTNSLQITKTDAAGNSYTTILTQSGTGVPYAWTLDRWAKTAAPFVPFIVETREPAGFYPNYSEVRTVANSGGTAATYFTDSYSAYAWGTMLSSSERGSTNATGSNSISYIPSGAADGIGMLTNVTNLDGSWSYRSYTAQNGETCALPNTTLTPYNGSSQGTGLLTTYNYVNDEFGVPSEPSSIVLTQTSGNTISTTNITYSYGDPNALGNQAGYPNTGQNVNGLFVNKITQTALASGSSLATTTLAYSQKIPSSQSTFLVGRTHSITAPDGTKTSYVYQYGAMNGGQFYTQNGGAFPLVGSCVVAIHGTAGPAAGGAILPTNFIYPTGGGSVPYAIDPLYVYDGGVYAGGSATPSSTLESTIRDGNGLVIRTELYVWHSSAWNIVSVTNYTNDVYGHVTGSSCNNISRSTNYGYGILPVSETDELGVTTTYASFDSAGRVLKTSKPTPSGANVTTTYTYDADNRVIGVSTGSSAGAETVSTTIAFDDAGRTTSRKEPELAATGISYSYNVANRSCTTNFPDSGARTDTYQNDGRLQSIGGSSVVPSFYTYSNPDSSGQITTDVYSGSSTVATVRYVEIVQDGYGRTVSKMKPGFSAMVPAPYTAYTESFGFDHTTGRLSSSARTSLAAMMYQYDALGQVNLTGLGSLTTTGTQRLTGTNHFIESISGAWWDHVDNIVYTAGGTSAFTTQSITRTRLSGFSTGQVYDQTVTDMYLNQVETSVVVNAATATETITTSYPWLAAVQTETLTYGLRHSFQGTDGLTTNYGYDGWDRLHTIQDPQGNTTTLYYWPGTPLVETESSPAQVFPSQSTTQTTNFAYDAMGRRNSVSDASSYLTTTTYDTVGRVTGISGTGALSVGYVYGDIYGDRTSSTTTRDSGSTTDTTQWAYDPQSGLLASKKDAQQNTVNYWYNSIGKVSQRQWARGNYTNYYYDLGNTGDLTGITYNDVNVTKPVSLSYYRFGALYQVTDGTGTRTFANDTIYPMQIDSETLGAAYNSGSTPRILSTFYNVSTTSSGPLYGPYGSPGISYTQSLMRGRPIGFTLGVVGNTARDLQQTVVYSNIGQLVGVQTVVGSVYGRNFIFSYGAQNATGGGYAGLPLACAASSSPFQVNYAYEPARPLLASVNSQWTGLSSPTLTRFDYTDNILGQRATAMMSGSAFGDYFSGLGYSQVYRTNTYDGAGQLNTAISYSGNAVSQSPGVPLPAEAFQYRYDSAGNRLSDGETGLVSTGDNSYSVNSLNQYNAKENNIVRVLGTSSQNAVVSLSSSPTTSVGQVDRTFGASLVPANATGPVAGNVSVTAIAYQATTAVALATPITQPFFVGASNQVLSYDLDGNLTGDGMWTYAYDSENRLVSMSSVVAGSNGQMDTITFAYDYLGRRVQKKVSNALGTLNHEFVYSGTSVVAEISNTTGLITRSYTWGIGNTAPLLDLANYNASTGAFTQDYFPTYDGNQNLVSLVNTSTAAVAAVYEYGPFGELLRSQQSDSTVADNPIRFSSHFTDIETGLIYYGQRYYSPTLGRFINRDPIQEAGGANLYGFCGNDPLDRTDAIGQSFWNTFLGKMLNPTTPFKSMRSFVGTGLFGPAYTGAPTFFNQYGSEAAGIAAGIVVGYFSHDPELGGAAGGFVASSLADYLNGGSVGDSLVKGAIGAGIGYVSAGIAQSLIPGQAMLPTTSGPSSVSDTNFAGLANSEAFPTTVEASGSLALPPGGVQEFSSNVLKLQPYTVTASASQSWTFSTTFIGYAGRATLGTAVASASYMVNRSLQDIGQVLHNHQASMAYQQSFGDYDTSRALTVQQNFETINSELNSGNLTFNSITTDSSWYHSNWIAFVRPSADPNQVNLEPNFWLESANDRAGTVIHELAHLASSSVIDRGYAYSILVHWAQTVPFGAVTNAQNYAIYAQLVSY